MTLFGSSAMAVAYWLFRVLF